MDFHSSNLKNISELITDKRKARKFGQQNRFPVDKKHLNFLSQKLKRLQIAHENRRVQGQLERLGAAKSTDYSLWKMTKNILKPICSQTQSETQTTGPKLISKGAYFCLLSF